MKQRIIAAATAGAAALLAAAPAQAQIPVEELARTPAVTGVTMSDDGTYLTGLITPPGNEGTELALTVWDLTDEGGPTVTPANDRMRFFNAQALKAGKLFVRGYQAWTGQAMGCLEGGAAGGSTSTFVYKTYITGTEMDDFEEPFQAVSTGRGGGMIERCFELSGEAGLYQNLPLSATEVIAFRMNSRSLNREFIRVNLETGEETLLYEENSRDTAGLFDPRTAELLTLSRMEPQGGGEYLFQTLIRNPQTGEFEVHDELTWTADDRRTINIAGRDEETGKYYIITDLFSDYDAVYMYDAATRTFDQEPVFAHKQFNATGVILGTTEESWNELIGFRYMGARGRTYYVDPEWASIQAGLQQAYPGKDIDIQNATDDLSKILFSTSSSTTPPVWYVLEDRRTPQLIGAARPWIDSEALRPTELVYYTARDGLQIPALLTLPKGFEAGADTPLPTVVMPHGGPWARDRADWDASGWPQFLASRGYAVLQPQYRGSDGWSRSLWLAGDAEWGLKMQDDKDDGLQWLVDQGIADPNRAAIFGYSYGGFAAMAATVRPNSPFQCAIAGAGVSNLERLGRTWSDNRVQRALQGKTVKGMDPIENAAKANIPILVYHGDRDVRVPLFHGRDFYNAVKDYTDAELLVVEDMPHSMPWWPEHHRQTLSAIEEYLANDCGLKPGPVRRQQAAVTRGR